MGGKKRARNRFIVMGERISLQMENGKIRLAHHKLIIKPHLPAICNKEDYVVYMRKWIKQIKGKHNCGIIAVAVIAGCSIKRAEEAIGYKGYTDTKDLQRGLMNLGFKCPGRLKRLKIRPKLAIAKLTYPDNSKYHWVVVYKEKIFDGAHGNKQGIVNWEKDWRITSYLPIKKINKGE